MVLLGYINRKIRQVEIYRPGQEVEVNLLLLYQEKLFSQICPKS